MENQDQQLIEGELQRKTEAEELAQQEYGLSQEAEYNQVLQNQAAEEEMYANQLASEQFQSYNELRQLQEQSQSFGKASLLKYLLILLVLAIPNDIIDAIELTGFLVALSWFISLFLSATTIFVTWFFDSEVKKVKEHMSNIERYKKTLARNLTRITAKITKFAPRNPVVKVIAGAVLEMIPFISMLPWSSISVIMAYLDERHTFNEARNSTSEIGTTSESPIEVV